MNTQGTTLSQQCRVERCTTNFSSLYITWNDDKWQRSSSRDLPQDAFAYDNDVSIYSDYTLLPTIIDMTLYKLNNTL